MTPKKDCPSCNGRGTIWYADSFDRDNGKVCPCVLLNRNDVVVLPGPKKIKGTVVKVVNSVVMVVPWCSGVENIFHERDLERSECKLRPRERSEPRPDFY